MGSTKSVRGVSPHLFSGIIEQRHEALARRQERIAGRETSHVVVYSIQFSSRVQCQDGQLVVWPAILWSNLLSLDIVAGGEKNTEQLTKQFGCLLENNTKN